MIRRALVGAAASALAVVLTCPSPALAASYVLRLPRAEGAGWPAALIRVDDPQTSSPGPATDVGATDFTIEWFMKGLAADNDTIGSCGASEWSAMSGMILDRTRHAHSREITVVTLRRHLAFSVLGPVDDDGYVLCGSTDVLDGFWHHVAVQRRATDGRMEIWVDGRRDAAATGPSGDVSYPDDALPALGCGGTCDDDASLGIGAKHDSYAAGFAGSIDELRISDTIRYAKTFARPARAFAPDAATVGLYHFDAGTGTSATDSSATANAATFQTPPPVWHAENAFADLPGPGMWPAGHPASPSQASSSAGPSVSAGAPGSRDSTSGAVSSPSATHAARGGGARSRDRAAGDTVPRAASGELPAAVPVGAGIAALGFGMAMLIGWVRRNERA